VSRGQCGGSPTVVNLSFLDRGGTYHLLQLLVTANFVSSSPIHFSVMVKVIRFSKTSVLTRTTPHDIPIDGLLHERDVCVHRKIFLYYNSRRREYRSINKAKNNINVD
jgi:hypothetical protein